MLTAKLTGAQLDFWVARAEGIPGAYLEIRQVPRTDSAICVRTIHGRDSVLGVALEVLAYSTNWAQGGPLLESRRPDMRYVGTDWYAGIGRVSGRGDTMLQAFCRAVVQQAYGDNVEDRPCEY